MIHFPFFPNLFTLFDQLFLARDTVSFFLKFFLSISNFLISGNFLKSGISEGRKMSTILEMCCTMSCKDVGQHYSNLVIHHRSINRTHVVELDDDGNSSKVITVKMDGT